VPFLCLGCVTLLRACPHLWVSLRRSRPAPINWSPARYCDTAAGYESTLSGDDRRSYDQLIDKADRVTHLDFPEPSEQAYWAAGQEVVNRCDLLIAIWDGKPSRGLGGTGDVVEYARAAGKDVRIIWPSGAVRA